LVSGAPAAFGQTKTHRRLPAMGCEILLRFVYGFNLPPPTVCATATQRSHAARFGIQFSLVMTDCISSKM
jgi:hypothetical protein